MAGKAQPARQIGKAKLLGLVKAAQNCSSRCAEERQALGAKMESAATSDNFNAKALRPLMPLLKMDPGPQAHLWRTMLLYADHLGIGAQGDLEDVIDADAAREDGEDEDEGEGEGSADPEDVDALAEGEGSGDPVEDVLAGMVTPNLGRFRSALDLCMSAEAVNKGLERFTTDHPDDADAALEMAQARLEAIDLEAGGGEDLRSTAQIEAERQQAADTVHAATGKKPTKRKSTRKDAGKVGQEAAPGFGQAVH